MSTPQYVHRLEPGDPGVAPLLLLHGSDGSELDLLPLAGRVAPAATRLALRGTAPTGGGWAFFRRFPDRRIDEADLAARVAALADDVGSVSGHHGLGRPIAVGYSNGAITAAALLVSRPALLTGAILFRPLSPWTDDPLVRLDGTPVLIIDGSDDERRSPGDGLRLARQLERAGADVTHRVLATGHALTGDDEEIAADWIRTVPRPE